MKSLTELFENNQAWATAVETEQPGFFNKLRHQQTPEYLWIGCSDSRVPANEIVGLLPGELFVHRNVSNMIVHTDLNCLSVIQYAVDVLKVKHVIVCGHYGCGGVSAALSNERHGLIDNWLQHIKDVRSKHKGLISELHSTADQADRLCELNVIEQVMNVAHTTIVHDAWERGQSLNIHGWIYGIKDGILKDLNIQIDSLDSMTNAYSNALATF